MEKDCIWTVDGDETSWASWAEAMESAAATSLMNELIDVKASPRTGWSVDLGCGTGRAFLPLIQAGYRVAGIDPVKRGIQLSQQRVLREGYEAFPLQASLAQLPIRNDSTAFVFAINSLFHLSHGELTMALHEIYRVLLPDGKAVLHFLDIDDWRRSLAAEISAEEAPNPSYKAVLTCFSSKEAVIRKVSEAGLRIETINLKTNQSEAGKQRNWFVNCGK